MYTLPQTSLLLDLYVLHLGGKYNLTVKYFLSYLSVNTLNCANNPVERILKTESIPGAQTVKSVVKIYWLI